MAVRSTYELKPRRDGGYDVVIRGASRGIVYPYNASGWFIYMDKSERLWANEDEAAEEILRQFEAVKAGG